MSELAVADSSLNYWDTAMADSVLPVSVVVTSGAHQLRFWDAMTCMISVENLALGQEASFKALCLWMEACSCSTRIRHFGFECLCCAEGSGLNYAC